MSNVFKLNPEQELLLKECSELDERFGMQPALYGSATTISAARSLIERAFAAGLPPVAYSGLQVAVGIADADAALPEHLRQYKPLP